MGDREREKGVREASCNVRRKAPGAGSRRGQRDRKAGRQGWREEGREGDRQRS